MKLILASNSPRRKELLKNAGFEFSVIPSNEEENADINLPPDKYTESLAIIKANSVFKNNQNAVVIGADTVVYYNGEILGKPKDKADAMQMLRTLSGKKHEVITAVCVFTQQKKHLFYAVSQVSFKPLLEAEIAHYVDTYQPFDKAGSYGVQEWIGYIGIEKIVGSYYNVMGLPIQRLYQELKTFLEID